MGSQEKNQAKVISIYRQVILVLVLMNLWTVLSVRADKNNNIILKEHVVNGVNILMQEDMNEENTVYTIQYDFKLGEDITVPRNSVLEFDGGSINGEHTLKGYETRIVSPVKKVFGSNVSLSGSFVDFCIDWLLDDDENDVAPFVTKVWDITNSITFKKKHYTFRSEAKVYGSIYASNAKFNMYGNGCLTIENTLSAERSVHSINIFIRELHGHDDATKGLYIKSLSFSTTEIEYIHFFTQNCVLIEAGTDSLNTEVAFNNFKFSWLCDAPILINVRALSNGWVNDNVFHDTHFAGGEYKREKPKGANRAMVWENPNRWSYNHNLFRHLCCEGVEGVLFEFNNMQYSVIDFLRYEAGSDDSKIVFKNRSFANKIQDCFYDMKYRIDDSNNQNVCWGNYQPLSYYGLRKVFSISPMSDYFEQATASRVRPKDDRVRLYDGSWESMSTCSAKIRANKDILIGETNNFYIGFEVNTQEQKVLAFANKSSSAVTKTIYVRYLEIDNVKVRNGDNDITDKYQKTRGMDANQVREGVYSRNIKAIKFESTANKDIVLFVPQFVTKIGIYIQVGTGTVLESLDLFGENPNDILGFPKEGTTADRPVCGVVGFEYFDTTIGKPIWWNGTVWVDALGVRSKP